MSGSRLPPLRPLTAAPVALPSDLEVAGPVEIPPGDVAPLPWEGEAESAEVESELKSFCRAGELVYAAVVDRPGTIACGVCTVGARPHNEAQIGELVAKLFSVATLLGDEVGEKAPEGLNLQGSRWSYSLDPITETWLLFGIYSSQSLPAIVRACAHKAIPALEAALAGERST